MTYTKDEFVRMMAKKGYTIKACNDIVNDFIDTMIDILVDGNGVQFRGFGAFDVRERREREAKSPATGKPIVIPARKAVRFSPGEPLKRQVKQGKRG